VEDKPLVRVGIIGCGYWGPNLVRTFAEMEDVQVTRVSDLRPGRLEFIAQRFPEIVGSSDAATLVNDPSIDAIVIATPPKTHHELALAALQAGKHVLVEKPLATSVAEGKELVEAATREGKVLAVGHVFLYAPAVARVRSLFDEQQVGDLYYISAVRTNVGPPQGEVDALWDLAPHDISIILNVMKESPTEILAQGGSFTGSKKVEAVFLLLRFGDGRLAHVHVGWLTPNKVRLMRMVCSQGEVVYDDMQPVQKLQVHHPAVDNRRQAGAVGGQLSYSSGGTWAPSLETYEPLRAECQDFIRSIRTGAPPLSDGQSGLEVVRVLEAASQCLQNGGHSPLQSLRAIEPAGAAL
jgi:predicted dehydrogenase